MNQNDKRNFADMMNSVMELYGKQSLDKNTLRIWFSKLEKYSFDIVCKAFDAYVSNSNKYPTPHDILNICRAKSIPFTMQLPKPKQDLESAQKYLDSIKKKYGWDKII